MIHFVIMLCMFCFPIAAIAQDSVFLEELTWMEARDKISGGTTTVLIPTGGTEQNGPHMVLGKHNIIVHHTAGEIAVRLSNALVAPVIAYVPEDVHMGFSGTVSISEDTFSLLLRDAARSMKHHGFTTIVFIGDSGGNQKAQAEVAEKLSDEWERDGVQVIHLIQYYSNNGQTEWLNTQGFSIDELEKHAGIEDTSELMAIHPKGIREALRSAYTDADFSTIGSTGDSTKASVALGDKLLELKIQAAVERIRTLTNSNQQ